MFLCVLTLLSLAIFFLPQFLLPSGLPRFSSAPASGLQILGRYKALCMHSDFRPPLPFFFHTIAPLFSMICFRIFKQPWLSMFAHKMVTFSVEPSRLRM